MVTVYGMNEKVGNISFYDPQQEGYFTKPYSEDTGKMIDEEVRALIQKAYISTKKLLNEKKMQVEVLAKELLTKEVLFQSDVETLIGKRPYEEKKLAEVVETHHEPVPPAQAGLPPEVEKI
jgi:AFG3 family protein